MVGTRPSVCASCNSRLQDMRRCKIAQSTSPACTHSKGPCPGRKARATPLMPSIAPSTQGRFVFHEARLIQSRASRLSSPAITRSAQVKSPRPHSLHHVSRQRLHDGIRQEFTVSGGNSVCFGLSYVLSSNRIARERFVSSIRSISTTITCRKPSSAMFFRISLPSAPAPITNTRAALIFSCPTRGSGGNGCTDPHPA